MFKTSFKINRWLSLLDKKTSARCLSSISHIFKENKPGDEVTVKGWIKSLRNQKEHIFMDLSDGSTDRKLQVCLPQNLKGENLSAGASVMVSGPLTLSPRGQLELAVKNLQVCGVCVVSEGYPFAPRKQYTPEYIRQFLHFRPRTHKFGALLRVRNATTLAVYDYFNSKGFINIHTPILTANDCEGAGEVFKVLPENESLIKSMLKEGQKSDEAYFNSKAFLSVSGQLHLEAAAHGLSKVYCFGPTFRAENSRSRLHLSEFYMLEAEIAFIDKLEQLTDFVEDLLKKITAQILNKCSEDIERCKEKEVLTWCDKKFPVITYREAVSILEKNKDKFKESFSANEGLGKEHELFLVEHFENVPLFVVEWPKEMKPFYMKEKNGTVAAFDLLGPTVGEIVGGSLREDNYQVLKEKVSDLPHLNWYLELRKFGSVPSGGFGLGFERFLQSLLGIGNIKDVIPFPRWPHNCSM